ncbi:MAG: MFS transporter [Geminicoccaceae bacterium]|nr:MFS transporter [Geminicoccaceae bacterium]MCS7267919.1 MFS transporter [Geminicoccaceae bacterium]MDW8124451.1 MFS transporter [Geminicoccaceae bacterium]MDW8342482.1 MFS transporter [Geminicoccaceae bacterium]
MRNRTFVKNVSVLTFCQALFFMANTIVISTAPFVGLQYAPVPELATVPLGVQFLGTMSTTVPASLLMQRFGRRPGLALGMALGVLAGLCGAYAILQASFLLFCAAGVLYGAYAAFAQYLRFSAADAADAAGFADRVAARGRAIAWVMAGGVLAAVLGPELADRTRELTAPVLFAGSYLAIAALAGLALLSLLLLELPRSSAFADADPAPARPLRAIARQPVAIAAFSAALVGYVTMNLLMTATPLAMLACGHGFTETKRVIQWHVLGMFLPSFVTGRLVTRFGVDRVILAGVVLNLSCVAIAVAGVDVANFAIALFLLGVGWNFMFVGGTTLLTTAHTPAEKAKVQGLNDLLVFTSVSASASLAGFVQSTLGWQIMNLLALPGLFLVGGLVLARLRPGATASALPARGSRGL